MKLERVLVPISRDVAAEESLRLACQIAREAKAKVIVVFVIEVRRSLPLDANIPSEKKLAEEILTRAEEIAVDEDCEIETDLLQAREISTAIVEEALQREVDLIVMGTVYKKRFGFFHIGDTVFNVFRDAPCRVILLQEPPEGQNAA